MKHLLFFIIYLLAACSGDPSDLLDELFADDGGVVEESPVDNALWDNPLCGQTPQGAVNLPADDAPHDEDVEWWYWTGHLQTSQGEWFGYELTFFNSIRWGTRGQILHHGITDITGDTFHYVEQGVIRAPNQTVDGFDLSIGPHFAIGGDGEDWLHAEVDNYEIDLQLVSLKAPVFQHETGYTDYAFGGYTYYYSRERMATTGTISINNISVDVTGMSWFDHQWGTLGQAVNLGWDWFALQLDDMREIMLFLVHEEDADLLVGGSMTDENCNTIEIGPDDFTVTPRGTWTNPESGCTYPSGWNIEIAGMNLSVDPVMQNQEMSTELKSYWEGAAIITGDATGRAYIELTGYCE